MRIYTDIYHEKPMSKNRIKITKFFIVAISVVASMVVLNAESSIRVCVDGSCRAIHMPLYVKWIQFLARHYEYARLSRDIMTGCRSDEMKALAALEWTGRNMKENLPGMHIYDDHILYAIVRGYGVPEQFQDVFTTILSYGGVSAYYVKPYDKNKKARYALSVARIDGRWCVFDAYRGLYFKNRSGAIADIEDIARDPSIVAAIGSARIYSNGVRYQDFLTDLKAMRKPFVTRPERQMPVKRIVYEARKLFGLDKEDRE